MLWKRKKKTIAPIACRQYVGDKFTEKSGHNYMEPWYGMKREGELGCFPKRL